MDDQPESRSHERSGSVGNRNGRSWCYIVCPFCQTRCRAYVWSLAGGGKKCPDCGALHGNYGRTDRRTAKKGK